MTQVMGIVKAVWRVLISRWFVTLIGAVLLGLVVWFVGPLLGVGESRPLEGEIARLVVILVIVILWAAINIVGLLRERRNADRLMDGVAAGAAVPPGSANAAVRDEEVGTVRDRVTEALEILKTSKLGGKAGRRWIYQLPWYVIIGPPGVGKTTALVNSGLDFPLADRFGRDGLRGVGGTRNCDWWFTNEAVLIDTAGRYTTQDSQQSVDEAGWLGFLGLLKKYRPRQPINGALVCISLSDLAVSGETERAAHARAVRQRLRELMTELGVRFPVYVLFTKADLINGFIEFFDDLGREDREQAWGTTFPLDDGRGMEGVVGAFATEFGRLVERLQARTVERLQQESDVERRSKIMGFPAQFASLALPLRDFLEDVFRPSRFEERPLLRGVYFTSGTQEGTPFDRLMGGVARAFGLDRQQIPAFTGRGRSYFLADPLRRVAFVEADLVASDPKAARRRRRIRLAGYAAAAVVLLGVSGAWAWSYMGNRALIDRVEADAKAYADAVDALGGGAVRSADLAPVVPVLDRLAAIETGYDRREEEVPTALGFGLYQGDKLEAQTVPAYRRALGEILLPRLLIQLEERLRAMLAAGGAGDADARFQALKVYLMLGGQGPMDAPLVYDWMARAWATEYGAWPETERTNLAGHLAALLERPVPEIPLDGPLVAALRRTLDAFRPEQRAYAEIVALARERQLPQWTIAGIGGPQAGDVFVRPSGKRLDEGIAGFYTYDGFHGVFLAAVEEVAARNAADSWVLGTPSEAAADVDDRTAAIARGVLGLYTAEYTRLWEAMLADFAVRPFASPEEGVAILNILRGRDSPLGRVLRSASRETKLTVQPPGAGGAAGEAADLAAGALAGTGAVGREAGSIALQNLQSAGTAGRLAAILARNAEIPGATAAPSATGLPGQEVDDRFRDLHAYVDGVDGAPPPLDGMIGALSDLHRILNLAATRRDPADNARLVEEVAALSGAAGEAPEPMRAIAEALAASTSAVSAGGTRATIADDWKNTADRACRAAVQRYPFTRASKDDVAIDDFTRLFAPGGLIDGFFTRNLRSLVDISGKPWRWQRVTGEFAVPESVLEEFRRAALIRDAFYPTGPGQPNVSFDVTPLDLDPGSGRVTLEVNGQRVTYDHGPARAVRLIWPGAGAPETRLSFVDAGGGVGGGTTIDGPWGFFRLLDRATVRPSAADLFTVGFGADGGAARFEFRAGSATNPLASPDWRQFKCPDLS
jgi:type VI secretion system protein ImpL